MNVKVDLGAALDGLFPGLLQAHSQVIAWAGDDFVMKVTLVFDHEFDIEDRAEDCAQACERIRAQFSAFWTEHHLATFGFEPGCRIMLQFKTQTDASPNASFSSN